MSLVISFAPYADESGFGYYRRLAAENALNGWTDLARFANIHSVRGALMSRPEYLSEVLGLKLDWANLASEREELTRTWHGLHRLKADAVCPLCMRESAYVRHYWEHAYVTCCPVHKVRLVDKCDGCGKLFAKRRERIDYCGCGHSIGDSITSAPTPAELWLSSLITSGGASSGEVLPEVNGANVYSLCIVVRELCLLFDPSVPAPHRSAGIAKTIADAVELLAPLNILLKDWPLNFRKHVSGRIAAGNREKRTLNTLLGEWYRRLRQECQGTALEPFLTNVLEVAAQEFDGVLGNDPSIYDAAEHIDYLSVSAAARVAGVTQNHLSIAVHRGDVPFRSVLRGTRGKGYEVPKREAQRIAKERINWLREPEAAKRAGVSGSVMRSMADAGVVNRDPQWRGDICKAGPIEAKSIDTLYLLLVSQKKKLEKKDSDIVFWSDFTSRRYGSKSGIQSAMQAAQRGDLRPVLKGPEIGAMGFLRSEVGQYFGEPVLAEGMSLVHLSKLTGWKQENIRHWIDEGLLRTELVNLPGGMRDVILPAHLLEFRNTYVPLSDMARLLNTKASALARYLDGVVEMVGALSLSNGVRRGWLLPVAELGKLALTQARTSRG
ncbi:TniQ family protein [Alcaligenes phenolicus]|uniref:TniQ family protein n=1 Tax=Alcaligenes phenolicus TaxID=232846 RepID=A0AAW5VT72_9BURK|nr:TniQ family protein [Alcaligenes phenolicus]MCX5565669.1 TniQ family protein [Alcaligenes phenolicus]